MAITPFTVDDNVIDVRMNQMIDEVSLAIGQNTHDIAQLSNPNLSDNGDFSIWQRGTSFNISPNSGYPYTADRWAIANYSDNPLYWKTLIVSKVTDGLSIQKQANGQVSFQQQIELPNYLKNKNLVLSFEVSSTTNENLKVRHIGGTEMDYTVSPTPKKIEFKFNSGSLDILRLMIISNTKFITTSPASTITLKWVKLELGEIATPFSPRSYAEELAICKRFFERIELYRSDFLQRLGTGKYATRIKYDVPKRTVPTFIKNGTPILMSVDNNSSSFVNALNIYYELSAPYSSLEVMGIDMRGTDSAVCDLAYIAATNEPYVDVDAEIY